MSGAGGTEPLFTVAELRILRQGIAFWSSDYNDAPHADIERISEKLDALIDHLNKLVESVGGERS